MTSFDREAEKAAREEIKRLTKEYYEKFLKTDKEEFSEGDRIPYAGRVFDEKEVVNLVDSSLDFWLTAGRYTDEFEEKFAKLLGVKFASLVNSGSSANLIAFMALTAPELKERQIKRGDEVITVACGFPTTVAPILQHGAVPVFVDVALPCYNIDVTRLEGALSDKTKAVMIAHTLGNPFNLREVKKFCTEHNLWLVEDNCDSLGSEYEIDGETRYTGTWGDIGTSSFYPPHHMTMGEGGAVYTNNPELHKYVNSYRDWGRDCWCVGGVDNTCGCRFTGQFGQLPSGYDHKYVYSHLGYNLKATDLQAAIGCAQLDKLDFIVKRRRENYDTMYQGLKDVKGLLLPEPQKNSKPSWFGFFITVKEDAGYTRNELTRYLEDHKVQTRNLFAGNLLRHPAFEQYLEGQDYRVVGGSLPVTDSIMRDSFWLGLYPGMTPEKLQYMIDTIKAFVASKA